MRLLAKMFGSTKAIDAGIAGIDKAFYTAEEKADHAIKAAPLKVALLKAYHPFRLAQRVLSILFSVPYVFAWMVAFTMACFGMNIDAQVQLLDGTIKHIVWTIVGFYFLGGAGEGVVNAIIPVRATIAKLKAKK